MATFPKVVRTFHANSLYKPALRSIWAFVAAGLLSVPAIQAQYRGAIQGVVTDPSGAVVPGATLTLTNNATNEKQTVQSNGSGIYNFNALPPGTFTMTVEHTGFNTATYKEVQIIPEQTNSFNVKLTLSSAQPQTVTVNAAQTPLIDAENPTIGATISANEVQHMPTFGRDVFQLSQFAPGTISDMSQGSGGGTFALPGTQGPGGPSNNGGIFQTENGPQALANGNQYENNSIQIDGISTSSAVWRNLGDHADRRIGGRRARADQPVRRRIRPLRGRANHGDHQERHQPRAWQRVFPALESGAERLPALQRHRLL